MAARFSVLASGSSGNSAFVRAEGFGLLIDVGLGPRFLAARLAAVGASWRDVNAVVLTHTHTDHWKDLSFRQLHQHRIPLYCSPKHHAVLARYGGYFNRLLADDLVRPLPEDTFEVPSGITLRAIPVPHDSEPTFAYRVDGPAGLFGPQWSIGYAADLGEARDELIDAFADVNVLALEFNHCERMERASGRPRHLIERVLGDQGHLSNRQAADAVRAVVERSTPGALRHVVQLHLSRDCNRPALAFKTGRDLLAELGSSAQVTTAAQDRVTHVIRLDPSFKRLKPLVPVPA